MKLSTKKQKEDPPIIYVESLEEARKIKRRPFTEKDEKDLLKLARELRKDLLEYESKHSNDLYSGRY